MRQSTEVVLERNKYLANGNAHSKLKKISIFITIIFILIEVSIFISNNIRDILDITFSEQEWEVHVSNNHVYRDHDLARQKKFASILETFVDTADLSKNEKRVGYYVTGNETKRINPFVYEYKNVRCSLFTMTEAAVTDFSRVYKANSNLSTVYAHYGRLNKFTAHIYEGFILGVPGAMSYGHWMTDNIFLMEYIKPSFMEDKVLIVSVIHQRMALDFLPILGFDMSKNVLLLEPNEAVYVDKLYTFAFNRWIDVSGVNAIRSISKKLRKYAGVDKETPTDYILMNRDSKIRRNIVGFDQLVDSVNQKWPLINWKVVISKPGPIVEQVTMWAFAKFVLGPSGSNFLNEIFMSEGSVVLIFRDPSIVDTENNAWGAITGIWVLQIPYIGWEQTHYSGDPKATPVNIPLTLEFIGHCLTILETQQMVKNTSLKNLLLN